MSDSFSLDDYRLAPTASSSATPPRSVKLWSRQVAADIVAVAEASIITLSGLLPSAIYHAAGVYQSAWASTAQSALIAALIYRMLLVSAGMYAVERSHNFAIKPLRMLASLTLAVMIALSLGAPHNLGMTNVAIWLFVWVAAAMSGVILVRTIASDIIHSATAAGRFDERIAVYGAGQIARRVHDHLTNPGLGLRFIGVFDSRLTHDRVNAEGLMVAGGLDDLVQASQEGRIDRIIIALPQIAERRVNDIARRFADLSVAIHIVTHLSTDYLGTNKTHHVSQLGSVGLMDIKSRQHTGWAPIIKRTEDLVVGLVVALVVAPLLPLIALAVKLDSDGPILFKQRRRGRNQRVFEVLKFRTMTVMEEGDDVRQATKHDPRITRIGHILRRTSLDELPQIWNVLVGDMSLVGPRPHALVHDEKFGEMVETYANRHQMKPGVTGLAQVSGFRGETTTPDSIEGRVTCDLRYIRNWSLLLDIKILFLTVWTVIGGRNAH